MNGWLRRVANWLSPPRRLRFTREGKYFIGLSFGVGFAAINTGNNLFYLLLGMMLSLIIASGVLSEFSLRSLHCVRDPPAQLYAQRLFLMGVALGNNKSQLASFSIEVEDMLGDRMLEKKCFFLKLPAGRTQKTAYRHSFTRRGRYHFSGFRVSTKFPFGLFRKSRFVECESHVLVFPEVQPVPQHVPTLSSFGGEGLTGPRARRGDFFGMREFRDGDDPRDVHWRTSARLGRQMVREFEEEAAERISIFLDNGLPGGVDCRDSAARDGLERVVSLAASLAVDCLERGYAVRLTTRGQSVPFITRPADAEILLTMLALLDPVDESVPFAAPPERALAPIFVVRRGARAPVHGRLVEA